jgi:hypothetical protein
MQASSHIRSISQISDNDDALLAYMTATHDESHTEEDANMSTSRFGSAQHAVAAGRPISDINQQRTSRHVKFGEVEDVEEEMENRKSLEKERQLQEKADTRGLSPLEAVRGLNQGEGGMAGSFYVRSL